MDVIPEKSADKRTERDGQGRFLPGNNANPNGRPPKGDSWADIRRELLAASKIKLSLTTPDKDGNFRQVTFELSVGDEKTFRHAILTREISKALAGDMFAIADLMDREEGRPRQSVNLGGQKDNPLMPPQIVVKDAAQAQVLSDLLRGKKANES
jgi:hypothetical protein